MASASYLADLAIVAALTVEPTNAALLGDRIHPDAAPEEPTPGFPPFAVYRLIPGPSRATAPVMTGAKVEAEQLVYEVVWVCEGESLEPVIDAVNAGDEALDGLIVHTPDGATVAIGRVGEVRNPSFLEGGVTYSEIGFRYEVDVINF